jgi:hypothetical protein
MNISTWKRKTVLAAAVISSLALGFSAASSGGLAAGHSTSTKTSVTSMAMASGRGENDFGMTKAFFKGHRVGFTYTHGFFCDTSVSSSASSKCEVGAKWKKAPSAQHDPLFITVPLGFTPGKMPDCPANLTCVDHPMTIDLSRLEPALKPLYPQFTDAQLTAALKNYATPEHDHFITDRNHGRPEWWDVYVVGVTSPKTFNAIHRHRSYGYVNKLIKHGNKNVVGPVPSNLFLFFGV